MFTYSAFGLLFASELECPDFLGAVGPPDVHLRLGRVPDSLIGATSQGVCYQATSLQFLLYIENIARYLVSHGREITVEIHPGADPAAVLLFLTGSVFSALLYQRGILPVHGSAVATERGAVIFAGPSSCGKSTLAAEFRKRGYRVLADELCAIRPGANPELLPASPYLMLWADAAEGLGLDRLALRRARAELEKYIVPLDAGFSSEPVRLYALYTVEITNSSQPELTRISGLRKIQALAQSSYRPNFAESMQLAGESFARIASVAPQIRMAKITRPLAGFRVADVADVLEADFAA